MLRSAGLAMQVSAMALNNSPAPTNNPGSETSFRRLPATAAESGPSPMNVNINTLIVRARNRDELFAEACRIAIEHVQRSTPLRARFGERERAVRENEMRERVASSRLYDCSP